MSNPMEPNVSLDPIDVGRFGVRTVAVCAQRLPDSVEQLWRTFIRGGGALHIAAFLAALASIGQDICDNLPYKSR